MNTVLTILILVTSASQMRNGEATGLWLEEFAIPYALFRSANIKVTVASINGGEVPIDPRSLQQKQPPEWDEAKNALKSSVALERINVNDYAAIFMPGGHGTMFDLADNATVKKTIAAFAERNKVVSAVCHGPASLVDVKLTNGHYLVDGKKMTGFTNSEEQAAGLVDKMPFLLESKLTQQGAQFVAAPNWSNHVIVDGNLITGQNPQSSEMIAIEIMKKLTQL